MWQHAGRGGIGKGTKRFFILICRQQKDTVRYTGHIKHIMIKAYPHNDTHLQARPQLLLVPLPMGQAVSNMKVWEPYLLKPPKRLNYYSSLVKKSY